MTGEAYLHRRASRSRWVRSPATRPSRADAESGSSAQGAAYKLDPSYVRSTCCAPRATHGRRAQSRYRGRLPQLAATVIAPTGTIAFMMDCDTTGIEPDIALIKYKKWSAAGC